MASPSGKVLSFSSSKFRALIRGAGFGACLAALSFAIRTQDDPAHSIQPVAANPTLQVRTPSSDLLSAASIVNPEDSAAVPRSAQAPVHPGKAALNARIQEQFQENSGGPISIKDRMHLARDRTLAGAEEGGSPLRFGGRDARARPDLVVLSKDQLPAGVAVVSSLGGRVVVRAQDVSAELAARAGFVVEDLSNSRLGLLTGTILVRVKDWSQREGVLADHGLILRVEKPVTRFLFVGLQQRSGSLVEQVSSEVKRLEEDARVERVEAEVIYRQAVSK